jgi:hypothetical protein
MGTTLSPVDVCNVALSKIGAQAINSLNDPTNASSRQCLANFNLAYQEASRSGRWNCLLTTAVLTQIPQTPLPSVGGAVPPAFVPWTASTFYPAGIYVSYAGLYYQVINAYTSSTSFATDLATGNLSLYNYNGTTITNAVPWAPLTYYQANAFLSYGGYYYQVMYSYTSSNNFANDLTQGFLTQQDQQIGSSVTDAFSPYDAGSSYASGWAFQYALPSNFLLLAILNDSEYWDFEGAGGDDYELMGANLFTDASQAVVKYIPNQPDTTQFDPIFLDAITYKLAAAISTPLRQDGGALQREMLVAYDRSLKKAKVRNAGERQARRFNPIRSSNFNRARYGGTNG